MTNTSCQHNESPADILSGRVVRNTGADYIVKTDNSAYPEVPAKVKGNFRIRGIRTTNPVAVGDYVTMRNTAVGDAIPTWLITEVIPRRNYIIRRASNLSKESHIIGANLDLAALVMTLADPVTPTTFIDRFLATASAYNVPAALIINKIDLLDDESRELLDAMTYLYTSIGYEVFAVSAISSSLEQLKKRLSGITTLFSGNSGVGKSTLINRLVPGANARTAEISRVHRQGMHTTTFSQMYETTLDGKPSYIIDTPGIRGFGTIDFDRRHVAHYFPEIFAVGDNCRFGDCTHTHEPGCAVREAVDNHLIAESRYTSYLSILNDDTASKYRPPQ